MPKTRFRLENSTFCSKKEVFCPQNGPEMEQIHTSNNWIFVASARDRHFNKIVFKAKSVPAEQYRSLRYDRSSSQFNSEGTMDVSQDQVAFSPCFGNLHT
jgi:hypothetical protein